jgi:hypothetical protein
MYLLEYFRLAEMRREVTLARFTTASQASGHPRLNQTA